MNSSQILNELIKNNDREGYVNFMNLNNKLPYEKEYSLIEFKCMVKRNKNQLLTEFEEFDYKLKKLIEIATKYGASVTNLGVLFK